MYVFTYICYIQDTLALTVNCPMQNCIDRKFAI